LVLFIIILYYYSIQLHFDLGYFQIDFFELIFCYKYLSDCLFGSRRYSRTYWSSF
jgi:hypothetical protein